MTDLPTRLEGAAAGSRELDIEVGQALGLIDADLIYTGLDGCRVGFGNRDPWPDWTTSIDAAVALAERVLGETMWQVGFDPDDGSLLARLAIFCGSEVHHAKSNAATPALALCAAILRAHAEQVQG
jgi:hypothetical protein